jgi:hypothetical protein
VRLRPLLHLGRLTHLDLFLNTVGDAGARALARSRHLGRLMHLNLDGNRIGPEGARAVAESPRLPRLAHLGLNYNGLAEAELLDVARTLEESRRPRAAGRGA